MRLEPFTGELDTKLEPFTGELDVTLEPFTGELDATWGETLKAVPTFMKEGARLGAGGVIRAAGDAMVNRELLDTLAPIPPRKIGELEVPSGVTQKNYIDPNLDRDRAIQKRAEMVDASTAGSLRRTGKAMTDKARLNLEDATPENLSFWQDAVLTASQSLGVSLPALAASLATRSPAPGLAAMGATEFGSSYDEALRSGKPPEEAAQYATVNAGIEVLTEKIPLGTLLKKGTPAFKRLLKFYGQELVGENIATAIQDANEFSMKNPEASMDEWAKGYLAERPEQAARTTASTIIGATVQGGLAGGVHRVTDREAKADLEPFPTDQQLDGQEATSAMEEVFEPFTGDLDKVEGETFEQFQRNKTDLRDKRVKDAGVVVALKTPEGEVIKGAEGQIHATLLTEHPEAQEAQAGYVDKTGRFYSRAEAQETFRISDAKELPKTQTPARAGVSASRAPTADASGDRGLVVALRGTDGQVVSGKRGQIHAQLLDRLNVSEGAEVGFVDRTGRFYTKEEAADTTFVVPARKTAQTSSMPGSRYTGMLSEKALPEVSPPDKPIRREEIIKPLMKAMGVPLYQGRVKGDKRLGFFRHVVEEVRIKHRNDLEVTAHEVAHLIDDRYPEFKKAYHRKEFEAELRGVSYDAKKLHEGFAEFMRLFMTQETEAAQRAPKFYEWFTKTLENHKLGPILRDTQVKMHAWYSQGALKRAESKLGSPKVPLRQQIDALTENWDEKLKQEIFDALHGVKVAELQLKGNIQDATLSPYKSLRLVAGSRGIIQSIFKRGTINWDPKGNIVFTGKGLEQILNPVADRLDKVQLYFAGRRAQELKSQGRENLFRDDEIKAMLKLGQDQDIRKAFDEWIAFNKRMMDFYQASGIVGQEARVAMEEMNKNYVPFHRVYEEVTGETKAKRGSPFMRLKGGTANVNDILDNIANSVSTLVHASVLNKAKQQAYSLIDGPGGARFAAKIPKDARAANINRDQVKDKFLRAVLGIGLTEYQNNSKSGQGNPSIDRMLALLDSGMGETVTFFTFGNAPKGTNIDTVMRNGKLDFYEVADPMFLKAMQAFGPKPVGLAVRVLNGFKNTLTRMVTTAPDFQIPNLLRDSFMGFTLSKSGFVPVVDSLRGFQSRLAKDKTYWEYLANGGGFASTIHGETLRRNLEKFYSSQGLSYKSVLNTPQKLLDALDEFNSAFEYGTRLGEYKNIKARGGSLREAAFGGREISTDFAMRGSSDFIRFFALTVPFFNARLEGLYRLGREMSPETRKAFVTKAVLGITLPTLLLYLINKDDERYQALPDWLKDLHWVIFLPGMDEPLLIPKPFEVGTIFATIPERMVELIEKKDGKKFADAMLWNVGEALSLNPTPQIVRPLLDIARNKTFTGGPVVPEDLLDVEDFEQHRPWTSDTLIALGKHTGLSPLKMEALLRGYFGTLGMYALMATDSMVETAGEEPVKRLDELPVVRRFFKSTPYRNTSYEKDFYELAEESRKAVATFRKIVRENRPEEAEEYISDRGLAFGLSRTLEGIRSQIATINRQMRIVQNDRDLNGQEKRDALDDLMSQRNELFKAAAKELNAKELKEFRDRVL